MKKNLFFLSLVILSAILNISVSCASEKKLKVVASIAPLADFARQVGGKKVDVLLLLPPGASPHTYEPTPKSMLEVSKARVFIKIGAGLEFWADKLIAASNPGVMTVDCTKGLELIRLHSDSHSHGKTAGVDPHIWLDPSICIGIINKIKTAFSAVDPSNSSYYNMNAFVCITNLLALDKEISERVGRFRTREYITFHPAWNYFSRRYGLRVAGVIEEGAGKEPSPRHLDRIVAELKRMKTKIIFAEPQFSPKIAEAIAKQAGASVLVLDPVGGQKDRQGYIETMRYNLSVMESVMK